MEQKLELSTLSSDYPWLIAHDLDPEEDDTGDQVFFTIQDPISRFRCRIPELVGRSIRGCFHGWMVLSNFNKEDSYMELSLWNPVISKWIRLPRLILKDEDYDEFNDCCLTSPPDDPGSILLLMRSTKQNIVFFNCKRRKKSRRWTEMSYSEQMKEINQGHHDDANILFHPTLCNGNIYAWSYGLTDDYPPRVIQIDITVAKKKQVVINLVPYGSLPRKYNMTSHYFLKGSGTHLFSIEVSMQEGIPCDVSLYKFERQAEMGYWMWNKINDLKDTVFFVSLDAGADFVDSSPPIVSKLGGGYIHILVGDGDMMCTYNFKDKTISMYLTHRRHLPFCFISVWTIPEFRLHGIPKYCNEQDDQMVLVRSATDTATTTNDDDDDETKNEACLLLNIPFEVLEMIMKFCVGIEYLNFRATCKLCHLAAPMIQWSNERMRLQTYSSVSPWLMVIDKNQGIVTFTDPMFSDNKYFKKASPGLFSYRRILCSMYGWVLLYVDHCRPAFFNPITSDIIKLPRILCHENFSFSAPPTSPDCLVLASLSSEGSTKYRFHHVGREPFIWHRFSFSFAAERPHLSWFPTFCGKDVYSLFNGGGLEVIREIDDHDNRSRTQIVDADTAPKSCNSAKYYHVKCDQHHLLVMVEEYGESIEVFKLNDYRREWEKIDGLGSHMIYICDTSCMCMEAKIPEMENKIYFPRLNCENEKIVFYSMETCKYHTFNGKKVEQNILTYLIGTKQTVCIHAWIQPTWSS